MWSVYSNEGVLIEKVLLSDTTCIRMVPEMTEKLCDSSSPNCIVDISRQALGQLESPVALLGNMYSISTEIKRNIAKESHFLIDISSK